MDRTVAVAIVRTFESIDESPAERLLISDEARKCAERKDMITLRKPCGAGNRLA
jgi:hypothetical protein